MKALITGVTGFAGGHLAEHLLRCGDQVIGSAREAAWPPSIPDRVRDIPLHQWDISQDPGEAFLAAVDAFQPQVVYHLAGLSVPSECGDTTLNSEALAVNVHGAQRCVELVRRHASQARLVFISSCQVYGAVDPRSPVVREDSPLDPQRGYGKSKRQAEVLIERAAAEHGLDALILRAFNHSGPRQRPQMMLSEWAYRLANRPTGPLQVQSRDSQLDLTDVRDTVRAYRQLAESAAAGAYNVGSGRAVRSGDVLDLMLRRYHAVYSAGGELTGEESGTVQVEETRPGHRQLPIADLQKLQRVIDWQPEIPLEQTVADTLQYWMEQLR